MEDLKISGNPIRLIALLLVVACLVCGNLMTREWFGIAVGAVVGTINAVFMFGLATIVDAAKKYLDENQRNMK